MVAEIIFESVYSRREPDCLPLTHPHTLTSQFLRTLEGQPALAVEELAQASVAGTLRRRMISGATLFPVSRRARRPLSQSSQFMTSFIAITGTPDLESLGLFMSSKD